MDDLLLKISSLEDLADLGVQNLDKATAVLLILKDELHTVYNELGVIADGFVDNIQ